MTPGTDDGSGGADPPNGDPADVPVDGDRRPPTGDGQSATQYEWDGTDRPSTALLEAVAAETGSSPRDLPTLFEHVDGDALDALLQTARRDGADHVRVTLPYDGFQVEVTADGRINLRPLGGE